MWGSALKQDEQLHYTAKEAKPFRQVEEDPNSCFFKMVSGGNTKRGSTTKNYVPSRKLIGYLVFGMVW